jgi:hypothetical protein
VKRKKRNGWRYRSCNRASLAAASLERRIETVTVPLVVLASAGIPWEIWATILIKVGTTHEINGSQAVSGQRIGQRPEIGWWRSSKLHPFPKNGVKESKRRGVQSMSLFSWIIAIKSWSLFDCAMRTVIFVAQNWMTDVRQVHSNLMIASRK